MIITDTLSNLFSAIQNGSLSNKSKIIQINSKISTRVLNLFLHQGLIKGYKIPFKNQNQLEIFLKSNMSRFQKIQRLSKPGRRLYIQHKHLFSNKRGVYILSTSKGFVAETEAKKWNVGGELICKIL